jgi:hypothetical protein
MTFKSIFGSSKTYLSAFDAKKILASTTPFYRSS